MVEMKFVPKGWGFEKWIVNKPEYCGKLLYFVKGKRCSWHYHKIKDEVSTFSPEDCVYYILIVMKSTRTTSLLQMKLF